MEIKLVSSLEKIRTADECGAEIEKKQIILPREHFSYQAVLVDERHTTLKLSIKSPVAEYVKVYIVRNAVMDNPISPTAFDDDYITTEAGLMPDILQPIEKTNANVRFGNGFAILWVDVCLPENYPAGEYPVTLHFEGSQVSDGSLVPVTAERQIVFEVLGVNLPKQSTIFTQWFHADCIATAHNVEIYSEQHWQLIEKYIRMAADLGINMLLTPVLTPALDTAVGKRRPNVQLTEISKSGDKYIFDFTKLHRWFDICRTAGIEYFEISHLFSQWGCKYSPNIVVDGEYCFGWDVPANDDSYRDFLNQFIPSLRKFLREEGVEDKCRFHISDEPEKTMLDSYRSAYEMVSELLDGCVIMDALSDIDFYDSGLVKHPVCAIDHIEPFLEKKVEDVWAYNCCGQAVKVGNRFMSMPSCRNRIIGLQLYKYDIPGFLHWGYNFYFAQFSEYEINPYVTSSADKGFQSGDAFSVYPDKNDVLPSLRAFVFREGLQDVELCRLLESYIGKDRVVELIEKEAGMSLTFSEYPRKADFLLSLAEKMKMIIKEQL